MKELSLQEYWNKIIELGIATNEELQLITDINGYNFESLNDVIYSRTGYRDLFQVLES